MSLAVGLKAEKRAVEYLQGTGYSIFERNFHSRFGEIDIIALKEDILHFIEVKYSKDYDALTRITPSKLKKIIKTVDYYMCVKNINIDYQIDALVVNDETIEIVENITY